MALTAIMFAVQYYFIVKYEESVLIEKFGETYQNYRQRVPAFVPVSLPSLEAIEWPKDYSHALQSEKRTLTTIVVLLALLAIFG
jgi:hypothetical protein